MMLRKRWYAILLFACILMPLSACNTTQDSIKVRAEGRGFYWYFTLPGNDGEFDTDDDLLSEKMIQLPANKLIDIEVTSSDYLYMFRASKLNVKEVAVPQMKFNVSFTPIEEGRFELEVDPLCGFNFAHDNDIMGHLHITSNEEYENWIKSKS